MQTYVQLQSEEWRVNQSNKGLSHKFPLLFTSFSLYVRTRARPPLSCPPLRLLAMVYTDFGKKCHAPNSEYALNSDVRLFTRFYGIITTASRSRTYSTRNKTFFWSGLNTRTYGTRKWLEHLPNWNVGQEKIRRESPLSMKANFEGVVYTNRIAVWLPRMLVHFWVAIRLITGHAIYHIAGNFGEH